MMMTMSRVCHFNKTAQLKLDETFIEETDNTEDVNDNSDDSEMDMSTQV